MVRFLIDYIGKKIFPEHISIVENPDISEGLGTRPFDGEGVKTFTKPIVESGVLDTYLLDTYSAKQLKLKSTSLANFVN